MDEHSPKRFSSAVEQETDRPNEKPALNASTTTKKILSAKTQLYYSQFDFNSYLTKSIISLNPLQYVTRAATAVRQGLKEPAKTKAMQHESFSYNAAAWEAGKSGKKALVQTLSDAGK